MQSGITLQLDIYPEASVAANVTSNRRDELEVDASQHGCAGITLLSFAKDVRAKTPRGRNCRRQPGGCETNCIKSQGANGRLQAPVMMEQRAPTDLSTCNVRAASYSRVSKA